MHSHPRLRRNIRSFNRNETDFSENQSHAAEALTRWFAPICGAAPKSCAVSDRPAVARRAAVQRELRRKLDIAGPDMAEAAVVRTRLSPHKPDGWAMSAADQRVAELVERWMTSVELHARYLALNDADYAKVQDWPRHQRPSRWVVELARTRLLELKRLLTERQTSHDAGFAEALELMAFLTNLLGSEHVERFIPLAQSQPVAATIQPKVAAPAGSKVESRSSRPAAAQKPARRAASKRPATAPPTAASEVVTPEAPVTSDKATATVIADAVRLISWGREWPQLAGLIARLANRPPEAEVWKILRKHRAEIEAQARRPRD